MKHRTRPIADLSAQEKRALLAELLLKKAGDLVRLPERFAMPVTALQAEAALDPTIRPPVVRVEPVTEPARIFLTGATGFLGAFLLAELLQNTTADLYCLVRAANVEEGLQRLQRVFASYALGETELGSRVHVVAGDLSKPLLGLSVDQFRRLADDIEVIYHNGAAVNWIYPYSRLKAANVLGTQEVLRLACQGRVKPVHFVSTLAVFPVLANAEARVVREQASLDHGGVLYGGYTQSKWVAEKLVTMACARGLPVSIYRPAMITGQSQTGVWNTDDVLCKVIKSVIELGGAPDVETTINMVPVDYVSQAVVHLSRQPAALGKVFHLANSRPVNWRELLTWLRTFGYPVESLRYSRWRTKLLKFGRFQDNTAYYLVPLFSLHTAQEGPALVHSIPEFDCQNALAGLAGTSIACPPVNHHRFETYFSYFIHRGFLDAPPPGRAPTGGVSDAIPDAGSI